VALRTVYDDNIDYESSDKQDDFAANVVPGLTLNYRTELLNLSLTGEVDALRYFNQTDFDRTNQFYGIESRYRMFPRWRVNGNFAFRKDETTDTQLEETGRVTERTTRKQYDAGGGLVYQLTELSDIGAEMEYRKRNYNSEDNTDSDVYRFRLPYTKKFANQRDSLSLTPEYTIYDSDGGEDVKDYRFIVGWERLLSETLTSLIEVGPRYTDYDDEELGNDNNLGYYVQVGLTKTAETFTGGISYDRDLRANTDGNIIEVNRLSLRADKLLSERFGCQFYGAGYVSKESSDNTPGDKVKYFIVRPGIYYRLTENHVLGLTYSYELQKELDEPGNPVTQRNRVWLGLTLNFPKKWE
jgi:hypothetical protein